MFLLHILDIFLQQMNLFSHIGQLFIVGDRTGIHENSWGCLQFSSWCVVYLNAFRFQSLFLSLINLNNPFLSWKITGISLVTELLPIYIVELLVYHCVILQIFIIFEQFLKFLRANSDLSSSIRRRINLVQIADMLRNGIFIEYLSSRQQVFNFILLHQILIGWQFLFESEEDVISFGYDLVSEIEIPWIIETGLRLEFWLALEELYSLLCTVHLLANDIK